MYAYIYNLHIKNMYQNRQLRVVCDYLCNAYCAIPAAKVASISNIYFVRTKVASKFLITPKCVCIYI